MQSGLTEKLFAIVMVKLFPGDRALTVGWLTAVLQVTLKAVPREESNVRRISELVPTTEVFTTRVVPAAGTATSPAEAVPHTAGDAADAQLVAVLYPGATTE